MNSMERTLRRMRGEPVDRPPNFDIMMQFAAHHIGEKLSDYYRDYRVLVKANIAMLEDFELDVVQAISDPFREAADFGAKIEFPEDNLPISRQMLLANPDDLDKLEAPDPHNGPRMSDRIAAVAAFHDQVGGEVPIVGWVEGAAAEAADLRGVMNFMLDIYDRPDWLEDLLEICVQNQIRFARAQVEAGADMIGLGDSVASQVAPSVYRRFVLPYEQRIFDAVHEAGGIARLHICGDTNAILDEMVETGADIIDIDWMVNIEAAAEAFGDDAVLTGNFDPVGVMLQGSPEEVYQAAYDCLAKGGPYSISNAGCEIPDNTPHENLHAQTRAIHDFGERYCQG